MAYEITDFSLPYRTLVGGTGPDNKAVYTPSWDANSRGFQNYKVNFRARRNGVPFSLLAGGDGPRLFLEIVASGRRIDITGCRPGHFVFDATAFYDFLDEINKLDQWGTDLQCRLVVKDSKEEKSSNTASVRTPVRPWKGPLDPQRFADDASIRYVDPEKGAYIGRDLTFIPHGDHDLRYFTYKGVLETNDRYRGFACVGWAAIIFRVPHSKGMAGEGNKLAKYLEGQPFKLGFDPPPGMKFVEPPGAQYVQIGPRLLGRFLESAQGKVGDYLMWMPPYHTGLIRDGRMYECKPKNGGFAKFEKERENGGVYGYTPEEFVGHMTTLAKGGTFNVSRIPKKAS